MQIYIEIVDQDGVNALRECEIREGDLTLIEAGLFSNQLFALKWMDQEDDEHIHLPHLEAGGIYRILAIESHGWSYHVDSLDEHTGKRTFLASFERASYAVGYVTMLLRK